MDIDTAIAIYGLVPFSQIADFIADGTWAWQLSDGTEELILSFMEAANEMWHIALN